MSEGKVDFGHIGTVTYRNGFITNAAIFNDLEGFEIHILTDKKHPYLFIISTQVTVGTPVCSGKTDRIVHNIQHLAQPALPKLILSWFLLPYPSVVKRKLGRPTILEKICETRREKRHGALRLARSPRRTVLVFHFPFPRGNSSS